MNVERKACGYMYKRVEELEKIIGGQIKIIRIRENLTQEELSARSNISKSALFNLENGRGATIRTLVSVLNTLGATSWLNNLAPDVSISPIQIMELGKPRQRVRRKWGKRWFISRWTLLRSDVGGSGLERLPLIRQEAIMHLSITRNRGGNFRRRRPRKSDCRVEPARWIVLVGAIWRSRRLWTLDH